MGEVYRAHDAKLNRDAAIYGLEDADGRYAFWSRDGRALYYLGPDRRIRVVDYTATGDSFTAGTPRVLNFFDELKAADAVGILRSWGPGVLKVSGAG